MTDKVFIDSNLWLDTLIENKDEEEKTAKSIACIENAADIVISTQVVNEVCINMIRKGNKDNAFIDQFIYDFVTTYGVVNQAADDVMIASNIRQDYHFSYWDSLIVASALQNDCKVLYSEDMQHGLNVFNQLQICNPLS